MNVIITENARLDEDSIRMLDLHFMLGELLHCCIQKDLSSLLEAAPPNGTFCTLDMKSAKFIVGTNYNHFLKITNTGARSVEMIGNAENKKIRRNIAVISRDIKYFDNGLFYSFNTQDAQSINYKEFFSLNAELPVIQYHRRKGQICAVVPLPGYHSSPSWNVPKISDLHTFEEKRSAIIWRGALSGKKEGVFNNHGANTIISRNAIPIDNRETLLMNFPRFYLTRQSKQIEFMDFGLILDEINPQFYENSTLIKSLCRPALSRSEQTRFRYILALDGYDGPSNFLWALQTNSLVFRQISEWEIFGDQYFQPWVHFVPVKPDIVDIVEKFEWCEKNADLCQKMIRNAQAAWAILFAENYYMKRIQIAYAELNRLMA